jgi:UDP-glucuronate 4-epimerase
MDFVSALEIVTGKKAELRLLDMQPGDVKETYSDTNQLQNWVDWVPSVSIAEGVEKFFFWYQKYYKKNN